MAWHALVVVQLHVVVERREFLIAAQQVDEGLLVGDMGGDAVVLSISNASLDRR